MDSTICQQDAKPNHTEEEDKEAITNCISQDGGRRGLGPDVLHQYQGFWFIRERIELVKEVQESFQARDTDLIIATLPRSGTLWLKSMAFATIHRTRYGRTTSEQKHPLLTTSPHDLVPFIEYKYSYEPNCSPDHFTAFESPRLLATHIPYQCLAESIKNGTTNCKIVYLCRNPKDNFISLWTFLDKLRVSRNIVGDPLPIEEALDFFCNGVLTFGPFWDHILGYWKASLERPEKMLFLKYEDLKKEPKSELKRLAEFLGYPFSAEEESEGVIEEILSLSSFDFLKDLDVNKNGMTGFNMKSKIFFRKGEVGDWKNHLTLEMSERLDRLIEEKFQDSGLVFSD